MHELAASDAVHAPAGVLEGQGEGTLEVALGQGQLVVGHAVLEQPVELVADQLQHFWRAAGRRTRIDGEGAMLQIGGAVGVHGVDEPALLADLLEKPTRHAAAEDLVERRAGKPVVVAAREGAHAHDDIGLLRWTGADDLRPGRSELEPLAYRALAGDRRHAPLDARRDLVVVQVARAGQHQVRRPVVRGEVAGDGVAAEG